jgi:hypothetical protein
MPRPAPFPAPMSGHRRMLVALLMLVAGAAGSPAPASGQSVLENLGVMSAENARLYLAPAARGLGGALTAGIFDRPTVLEAFHVDLGFRVAAAIPAESDQYFTPLLPASVTWDHPTGGTRTYVDPFVLQGADGRSPSAVGDGAGAVLQPSGTFRDDLLAAGEDPGDYALALPAGLDLSLVPAATVQLSVGVGLGSEITLRFLPGAAVSPDVGSFSGHGFAARHEISRWFTSPLDLSVGVATQEVEVAEYMEASTFEGWLMAGRALGPLTLFGTAGLRRASVDVHYEARNPLGLPGLPADGAQVRFSSDMDTGLSWGGGARLQLLVMNLSGQFTAAEQNAFTLKVGLAFP